MNSCECGEDLNPPLCWDEFTCPKCGKAYELDWELDAGEDSYGWSWWIVKEIER